MVDRASAYPSARQPPRRLAAHIDSLRQLQAFNDRGGIPVHFDVMRSIAPEIEIDGRVDACMSLWATHTISGFVTKPKYDAAVMTFRFVTRGHVTYRHRAGNSIGTPTHATLVGFEDLREVQASGSFSALSGTIAVETLTAADAALMGDSRGLSSLAPVADIATPGMRALACSLRQIQRRVQEADPACDYVLPLVQEILSYQLLSAWPKRVEPKVCDRVDVPSRSLRMALDYIEANLSGPLTLADIAAAAGISVRGLQTRFRRDVGQTPFQFLIDQRLKRVHQDLISARNAALPVAVIAKRWGFAHMSDFGQRYRRLYGCTPSETRRSTA
ncbi:hypothetical protein ASF60_15535 [Methylobacterium sp. Leaf113]|uniref:AraC family transcriptional regulator n=1 Tax=Methylobacterium sp. Leaf113 TaxID=1736259 RepID=UPI0006FF4B89|nr:AraC family transcriptional regulator [Methylobacterium sp. Leaf113]KQP93337.1 hypothetical protein ASF60_15535 [Methylobacterium sp. Leaf113]